MAEALDLTEPDGSEGWWAARWKRPAGWRHVLRLAFPLVLSTGSWSIQHFVDRMFLFWYSPETMAAALPAGILAFTFICFFLGTAAYTNTFVAQYHGAGQDRRVGPSVWQGIYFALASWCVAPLIYPWADHLFALASHSPELRVNEVPYFRILLLGMGFTVYNNAISSFYTGLGRTWTVMWVNVGITVVNLTFDYCMIFGNWGFPEMGIRGAAWATNLGNACGSIAFTLLVMNRKHEKEFATRSGWRFDRELFRRLMRFGSPAGLQFMLDVLGFSLFVLIIGRLGTIELSATNLAFNINALAFMPMFGFGIACETLVGQFQGRERSDLAARATWATFQLTVLYMGSIALLYLLRPYWFIDPFIEGSEGAQISAIREMARTILYFVAFYCVFDTLNIIFAFALKGAGDTRFVMLISLSVSWLVMVLPTWIALEVFGLGIYTAWVFLTLCVIGMGFGFLGRFLYGKWRGMRVIEKPADWPAVAPGMPTLPTTEVEM